MGGGLVFDGLGSHHIARNALQRLQTCTHARSVASPNANPNHWGRGGGGGGDFALARAARRRLARARADEWRWRVRACESLGRAAVPHWERFFFNLSDTHPPHAHTTPHYTTTLHLFIHPFCDFRQRASSLVERVANEKAVRIDAHRVGVNINLYGVEGISLVVHR